MARVSENNITQSINNSMNKSKGALEGLQYRGAQLRKIVRPSDDPISSIEAMSLKSSNNDNKQFIRNANFSLIQLNITEKALEQLTEIVTKAKEIAIAQSSDIYNPEVRKNVSNEIVQLRKESLAIANKRIGQKYLFSGFKILEKPFNKEGEYLGDTGKIQIEVAKDFYIPINLNGNEVFFTSEDSSNRVEHPLQNFEEFKNITDKNAPQEDEVKAKRGLANANSPDKSKFEKPNNLFSQLKLLTIALENDDSDTIQNLLEKFDKTLSRLITLRTRVGSISKSIVNSQNFLEDEILNNSERQSFLVDADVAELFSEIQRQQEALKTTYKSGAGLMNKSLLDFLR